ncbi:hypothetical protein PUNSTDRAFT_133898 [Punctularia strigosozonata HHB-11173 SS5]|uniref:uncharacterized protein n=1 Tax=Punctularia strigosozonata (strain HHB-11173) TaxID=741275 RepID=UPI000441773A|nr:uncharacterized protein PUNSTDRAFT_133898 [Punctularia strigosozonata HHB-11173 SS5]EIN08712.1 hypothetical protein PUNSTDRAFT_133898 [Punctularia strigosozonata HHB-11173 SS5]
MAAPAPSPMPTGLPDIPIPPGMTVPEFEALQRNLFAISATTVVAFSIICWDYLMLLPDEIRLYRKGGEELWVTPITYAFIVLRYSVFVAFLPSLWFTTLQTQFCQLSVNISEGGLILIAASSGIIFASRAIAIWGGNKWIAISVGVLYVGMTACWIVSALQNHSVAGPPTPLFTNCMFKPLPSWASICYGASVVYDLAVFILSLVKLKSRGLRESAVSQKVYKDSLVYVAAAAAMNITVLVIEALPESFNLIKPTVVPFSAVVTVSVSLIAVDSIFLLTSSLGDDVAARVSQPEVVQRTLAASVADQPSG